ncbi:MAG: hypothetical protein JSS66_09450 [Armatimonadetes bacterium]|nr:hypothetical protein [Armatimonadota bacterium]
MRAFALVALVIGVSLVAQERVHAQGKTGGGKPPPRTSGTTGTTSSGNSGGTGGTGGTNTKRDPQEIANEINQTIANATWVMVFIAAISVGVTACQFYFLNRTLKATENAANAAVDAVHAERPFLVAIDGEATQDLLDESLFVFKIKIENVGRTPVFLAQATAALAPRVHPDTPDFSKLTHPWRVFNIQAGKSATIPFAINFDDGTIQPKRGRFLFGLIRYRDITGTERSTRFGFYVLQNVNSFMLVPQPSERDYYLMDNPDDCKLGPDREQASQQA